MGIVKKESNEHEDLLDEVHINLAHESEITQNSVFFLWWVQRRHSAPQFPTIQSSLEQDSRPKAEISHSLSPEAKWQVVNGLLLCMQFLPQSQQQTNFHHKKEPHRLPRPPHSSVGELRERGCKKKKERREDWGWGHRKKKKSGKDVMDWNEGGDWFEVRQDSVEVGRGKGREKEGGSGTQKKQHTFRAYLHVAASMTGNLGKFSTESAADGEGIKTKAESKREKKGKGRREGGEWGNKHWRGRVQTTWHGLSWVWEQDSKWVSRFQSEKRSGMWGRG